ncbi:MAG: ATP-binding cassette domain-containing protein [Ilumatobacteraceae bacterium]
MTAVIEATGLRKRYGETEALAGLDLIAESGRLTALLGPNGAGKTTLISAVATLLLPDAGTLLVGGIDAVARPHEVRRILGLAGQYASVEPAMSGRENLQMVARRATPGRTPPSITSASWPTPSTSSPPNGRSDTASATTRLT